MAFHPAETQREREVTAEDTGVNFKSRQQMLLKTPLHKTAKED